MIDPKPCPVTAIAIGHAGEILQGSVCRNGRSRRVLVSLPTPELWAEATFTPSTEGALRVFPTWKRKSLRAAGLAFRQFGGPDASGSISISDNIPVCRGLGSSTTDCVAAIRAVARWFKASLPAETVASLAQQAEGASDSTMFGDEAVAFLHCEGSVLERFGKRLPHLRMLVVEPAPTPRGIRTERLRRPNYTVAQMDQFQELLTRLKAAVQLGDAHTVGAVATASATINQNFLPKPHFDFVMSVAGQTGALGVAAAHSGTVLVLLYEAGDKAPEKATEARVRLAERCLSISMDLKSGSYCQK
jgi:uncharacterized protein involved in propanediol utilization